MQNIEKNFSNDTIFNTINTMFISLKMKEVRENNVYLHLVINTLIEHMKLNDSLFQIMYQNIIYCGSFYKTTKIEKPNEFDLNIILKLPVNYNYIQFLEKRPGYVQIRIEHEEFNNYESFNTLTHKERKFLFKYITPSPILNPDKFRFWIKSVICKVLNKLPKIEDKYILKINDSPFLTACIKIRESGPAFTIIFNIPYKTDDICVDLAPVFSFHISVIEQFTSKFHILRKSPNKLWFAIPVPLNNLDYIKFEDDICWRIAFSIQENEILKQYGNIKPVIRQMKKFRDMQNWKSIVSYYIETLFLNKVVEAEINIDKVSRTLLFFKMIEELYYACEQREIKWFWNEKYNLLSRIGECELHNISQCLKNIINCIKKNSMDQFIIAKYVLNPNEFHALQIKIQNNNANQEKQEDHRLCYIF